MDIRVQSVKFDADERLLEFVNKKIGKIEKFYDEIIKAEVTLSLLPNQENKEVKVKISMPGDELLVRRNAHTFEDAVVDCVDVIKEKIVRIKEKKAQK
jgi:putative sigma-54 modulation protein